MTKRPRLTLATLTLEYFKARVDVVGECWIWRGYKDKDGYGRMGLDGKNEKASRVIFAFVHGPIPEGIMICHDCPGGDNPSCINPDHLFPGTAAVNAQDMAAKGRQVMQANPDKRPAGQRNGAYTHPERVRRGETAGSHRLTETEVVAIRDQAQQGASMHALARQFGVNRRTIQRVVRRATWAHVEDQSRLARIQQAAGQIIAAVDEAAAEGQAQHV